MEERENYIKFIVELLKDITSVQDLKRIYTLVSVKHEKYE